MAFATSVGSVTGCAWAAIERPVIAVGSEVSWSIVNDTRLSRAMFAAFGSVGCTGNRSSGHRSHIRLSLLVASRLAGS